MAGRLMPLGPEQEALIRVSSHAMRRLFTRTLDIPHDQLTKIYINDHGFLSEDNLLYERSDGSRIHMVKRRDYAPRFPVTRLIQSLDRRVIVTYLCESMVFSNMIEDNGDIH